MEAKLVVVGGKANMGEVKLRLPMTIGRGNKADLIISHPTVSRIHCKLSEVDGLLAVRDNSSSNGTFIDDKQITEAVLRPGQQLKIGPITFRAEYDLPELIPAPPPSDGGSGLAETQSIDKDEFNFLVDELNEKRSEEKSESTPTIPTLNKPPVEGASEGAPAPSIKPALPPQATEETAVFERSPAELFEETKQSIETDSMFEAVEGSPPTPEAIEPPVAEAKSGATAAMDFDFLSELNFDEPATQDPPSASSPPEATAVAPAVKLPEPTAEADLPVIDAGLPTDLAPKIEASTSTHEILSADEPVADSEPSVVKSPVTDESAVEVSSVDVEASPGPTAAIDEIVVTRTVSSEELDWSFDLEADSNPPEAAAPAVQANSDSASDASEPTAEDPAFAFESEFAPVVDPAERTPVLVVPPVDEPASAIEESGVPDATQAAAAEVDLFDFTESPASAMEAPAEPASSGEPIATAEVPPHDLGAPFVFGSDSNPEVSEQARIPKLPEPETVPPLALAPQAELPPNPASIAAATTPVAPAPRSIAAPSLSFVDKLKKLLGLGAKTSKSSASKKSVTKGAVLGDEATTSVPAVGQRFVPAPLDDAPIPLFGDETPATTVATVAEIESSSPFDFGSATTREAVALEPPETSAVPAATTETPSATESPVVDSPVAADVNLEVDGIFASFASSESSPSELAVETPPTNEASPPAVDTAEPWAAFADPVAPVVEQPAEIPQQAIQEEIVAREPMADDIGSSLASSEMPSAELPAAAAEQDLPPVESEQADPWAPVAEPDSPEPASMSESEPALESVPVESDMSDLFGAPNVDEAPNPESAAVAASPANDAEAEVEASPFADLEEPVPGDAGLPSDVAGAEPEGMAETAADAAVPNAPVDSLFELSATSPEPLASAAEPSTPEEVETAPPFALQEAALFATLPTAIESHSTSIAGVTDSATVEPEQKTAAPAVERVVGQGATRPYWIDADVRLKLPAAARWVAKLQPFVVPAMEPELPAGRTFNRVGKPPEAPMDTPSVSQESLFSEAPGSEWTADSGLLPFDTDSEPAASATPHAADLLEVDAPDGALLDASDTAELAAAEEPISADVATADGEGLTALFTSPPDLIAAPVETPQEPATDAESLFAELDAPAAAADPMAPEAEGLTELFASENAEDQKPVSAVPDKTASAGKPPAADAELDEFFKELGMG